MIVFDRQRRPDRTATSTRSAGSATGSTAWITGATPIIDPFSAAARAARSATSPRSPTGSGRSPATAKRRWSCWRSTPPTAARSSTASTRSAPTSREHRPARPQRLRDRARPGSPPTSTRSPNEAGKTLLIATLGLVLILLLLVYRAPLLALLPLIAVGAAYLVAIGIAYLLIKAGWIIVNTEGTFLLWCSSSAPAPTTRCCSSTATARSCRRGLKPASAALPRGAARERPGDRRLGRHRDRGDARPARRRPAVDPLARPDPGDRDRGDARLRLHPAARAARGARRARLLARRRGARPRPARDHAAGTRVGGAGPAALAADHRRSSSPACSSSPLGNLATTARSASARARPSRPTRAAAPRS